MLFLAFSLVFFFGTTLANAASDVFVSSLTEGSGHKTGRGWRYVISSLALAAFFFALFLAQNVGSYEFAIALLSMLLVAVGLASAFQVSQLYFYGDFVTPGVTWALRWIAIVPIITLDNVILAALAFYTLILVADVFRWIILRREAKKRISDPVFDKSKKINISAVLLFMFSASLSGLNPVVDRLIANFLPVGAVSQLEFVERVASLFLLLPTIGVMQVINVEVNKKIKEGQAFKLEYMLVIWFIAALCWSFFCSIIVFYFFDYAIALLNSESWIEKKRFTSGVLILIATAPSMFVGMICVRILLGLKKGRVVLVYSFCSLVFNAAVSAPLSWALGVNGILIGTLLTYSFTGIFLIIHCSRCQKLALHTSLRIS